MLRLIQKHTINIYNLTNLPYTIEVVKARTLLSLYRFDLYAKLFYIKYRERDKERAIKIYNEHIKIFNPDLKEPGRSDKSGLDDFIRTFDSLIDYFKINEFDSSISIIPVGKDNVILDGAHRIAALAYWDKDVTIARFCDVTPKGPFDYNYFIKRGLSREYADTIANEILNWNKNIYIACLWPKMGSANNKQKAFDKISSFSKPFYHKNIKTNINALTLFIAKIYNHQDWIGDENNGFAGAKDKALNCYSFNSSIDFLFFNSKKLSNVVELKDSIRTLFPHEKHSIHITDTDQESEEIAHLILTPDGLSNWLYRDGSQGVFFKLRNKFSESIFILKNVTWLKFKIKVASFIFRFKSK